MRTRTASPGSTERDVLRRVLPCCLVALCACSPGTGASPTEGGPDWIEAGGATGLPGSGGAGAGQAVPSGTGGLATGGTSGGAGGGSGGTPGAGGTTKLPVALAEYDQSVTFDWPESAQVGTCKAGHYQGTFAGIYSPSIAFAPGVPIPVAGGIDLTLGESADGEFFTVSDGKVDGVADGLFPFSADIEGTLNCTTGELEGGFLRNGVYIVGVLPYPFEGPLTSAYDKLTQSFTGGKWTVGEPTWSGSTLPYGGAGDWNAKLVP